MSHKSRFVPARLRKVSVPTKKNIFLFNLSSCLGRFRVDDPLVASHYTQPSSVSVTSDKKTTHLDYIDLFNYHNNNNLECTKCQKLSLHSDL